MRADASPSMKSRATPILLDTRARAGAAFEQIEFQSAQRHGIAAIYVKSSRLHEQVRRPFRHWTFLLLKSGGRPRHR